MRSVCKFDLRFDPNFDSCFGPKCCFKLGFALLFMLSVLACKSSQNKGSDGLGLVPAYLALGQALAADSATRANAPAKELFSATRDYLDQPGVGAIASALASMPRELEAARATYRQVSEGFLEYLDAYPEERSGLTLVYCPMAFANTGAYWVQREGDVANPYEGSRMLTCGAKLSWEEASAHRARWFAAQQQPNPKS